LPATRTKGFGIVAVSGRMRFPRPAASTIAVSDTSFFMPASRPIQPRQWLQPLRYHRQPWRLPPPAFRPTQPRAKRGCPPEYCHQTKQPQVPALDAPNPAPTLPIRAGSFPNIAACHRGPITEQKCPRSWYSAGRPTARNLLQNLALVLPPAGNSPALLAPIAATHRGAHLAAGKQG